MADPSFSASIRPFALTDTTEGSLLLHSSVLSAAFSGSTEALRESTDRMAMVLSLVFIITRSGKTTGSGFGETTGSGFGESFPQPTSIAPIKSIRKDLKLYIVGWLKFYNLFSNPVIFKLHGEILFKRIIQLSANSCFHIHADADVIYLMRF